MNSAGISVPDLAKHLHVSATTVSCWRNSRRLPTAAHASALSKILGKPISVLMQLVEELTIDRADTATSVRQ
jgi:transcriptional regulator with XRE-family HTH domain